MLLQVWVEFLFKSVELACQAIVTKERKCSEDLHIQEL